MQSMYPLPRSYDSKEVPRMVRRYLLLLAVVEATR